MRRGGDWGNVLRAKIRYVAVSLSFLRDRDDLHGRAAHFVQKTIYY